MRWVTWLFWAVCPCRHMDARGDSMMYRERRTVGRVDVLHLVCSRCGHARPVMDRSEKEHRAATMLGAASSTRLRSRQKHPGPAVVLPMRRKDRSR